MESDPVCGMRVGRERAAAQAEHAGRTYYFCSAGCAAKFRLEPENYLPPKSPDQSPEQAGLAEFGGIDAPSHRALSATVYICPMDPEIRLDHPGPCPICGMALEARTALAYEDENPELRDMRRRFWISSALAIPILVLAMADSVPGLRLESFASGRAQAWFELALATPVVLWGGWPFLVRAWTSLVNRSLNMFTLIGLGVAVAYVYSVVATGFPGVFPDSFQGPTGEVAPYFEAASVIVALVLLGQVLELRARSQTGAAIKALLSLAPKTARLVRRDGTELDIPLEEVSAGDSLRIRP